MSESEASDPITVLNFCEEFGGQSASLNGTSRVFQWCVPALNDPEFRVLVCSRKGPDAASKLMQEAGIDPMHLGYGKADIRNLFALKRLIKEKGVDVLHAHGFAPSVWAVLAGRLAHVPVIVHEQRNAGSVPWYRKPVEWILGPMTRKAFAVSESTRDFCIRHRHMRPDRVEVLYNGVPPSEFVHRDQDWVTEHREKFGCGPENPVMGIVGRLEQQKGHRDAFEALVRIREEWPTLRLWMIGDGPDGEALREEVAARGLEDMVIFTGFLPDVRDWMQCLDVMLFPSHREGTPNALFEALHTRRCIVASRADGQGEILRNRLTGLLYEPGNVEELTKLLLEVLRSADLRELLASTAKRMSREYDGSDCLRRLREVYRELATPDSNPE